MIHIKSGYDSSHDQTRELERVGVKCLEVKTETVDDCDLHSVWKQWQGIVLCSTILLLPSNTLVNMRFTLWVISSGYSISLLDG